VPIARLWLLRLFIVSIARHNFTLLVALTTSRRLVFDKTNYRSRSHRAGSTPLSLSAKLQDSRTRRRAARLDTPGPQDQRVCPARWVSRRTRSARGILPENVCLAVTVEIAFMGRGAEDTILKTLPLQPAGRAGPNRPELRTLLLRYHITVRCVLPL
jgi:hypothetical protein